MWKASNSVTVSLLRDGKFDTVSRTIPNRISDLLDCEPIASLITHAGSDIVKAYVESELIKLAANFNGNPALNLKDYQVPLIAEMLIENYRWESIEDFTLCFRKASAGLYGEIYRIDGAVIGQWFSRYLDEKYQALEERKQKEKQLEKAPREANPDRTLLAAMQTIIEGKKLDVDLSKYLTPEQVREVEESRRKHAAMKGYSAKGENEFQRHKLENRHPVTPPEEVERKLNRIRELQIKALRDKHPGATDEEINQFLK